MSFNIGNQTGGVINNVAGNQYISGDQRGTAASAAVLREALEQLRAAVGNAGLDDKTSTAATAQLDEIDSTLTEQEPDRPKAGKALDKLAALLVSAGAVATAGQALAGPIQTIASWVGSWGPAVAQLLAN